jgi:hypothetical protein
MAVFWVVMPCRLVWVYQCFRGLYCLHHQGDRLSNVGKLIPVYVVLQPRWQAASQSLPWEPQVIFRNTCAQLRGLVVDCIALPVSGNTLQQHSQNVYTATRVSTLPMPLVRHYVVHDYGPGSTPRPAYRGSEMMSPNLNFWVLCRQTQVGSCANTAGQQKR